MVVRTDNCVHKHVTQSNWKVFSCLQCRTCAFHHISPLIRLQVDLINYGLIPEFVGRFPIICSLQARPYPFKQTSAELANFDLLAVAVRQDLSTLC